MNNRTELLKKALQRTKQEVAKVIIGQEDVIDLADVIVEMASGIVKATIAPEMRELLVSEARKAASHLRSLRKEKDDQ